MKQERKRQQHATAELERKLAEEEDRRKELQKELQRSRELLMNILREIPAIVYATDEDGSVVFFNREFERVSGYTADDLVADPRAVDLLIPADGEGVSPEDGAGKREGRWQFTGKDGAQKTVKWSRISSHMPLLGWKSWKIGIDVSEQENQKTTIRVLSGLLPICASCKKIRDDKGYWNQLEAFIRDHSEAEFSHGLCPDCIRKLYPGFSPRKVKRGSDRSAPQGGDGEVS